MTYDENITHFEIECSCGCGILQLLVDKEDGEGYLEFYELGFYAYQRPLLSNLRENLKLIWAILKGKRYCFYSIVISKEKMEEFKRFVGDLK